MPLEPNVARTDTGFSDADLKSGGRENLGADLRALRRARGVSLAELAEGVGRSIGFVSQVERGLSDPSMDDLRQIAAFYGVPVGLFFGAAASEPREQGKIVRAAARRKLGRAESGLIEELLTPELGGAFEITRSEFSPGAQSRLTQRDTEEAGYVVSGRFDIAIDGEWFELRAGDSFRVDHQKFQWRNPSATAPAVVIWVIAPPIY
ncbi:MAG: XRE family transcriptional regulator [Pseudomonadota bacterium]